MFRPNPPPKLFETNNRQANTVVSLCKKRRSGSCDNSPIGRPFINPIDKLTRDKPRRSFFRDVSSPQPPASDIPLLIAAINTLSPSQAFRVALALGLKPPQQSSLLTFVSSISPNDERMIGVVNSALQSVVGRGISASTQDAPVEQGVPSDFFDCRYSPPDALNTLVQAPLSLGTSNVDYSFQIPLLPQGLHCVIQCFSCNGHTYAVNWPFSMRLFVNGRQFKPVGKLLFPLIDVTHFGQGASIRIICGAETERFLLFVRVAKYESFKSIVMRIQNEPAQFEQLNDNEICLISPMTGDFIRYPGRTRYCTHTQCFDLKELIKRATLTREWMCPICRSPATVRDLIYSHATKKVMYDMNLASFEQESNQVPVLMGESVANENVIVLGDKEPFELFGGHQPDEEDWQF